MQKIVIADASRHRQMGTQTHHWISYHLFYQVWLIKYSLGFKTSSMLKIECILSYEKKYGEHQMAPRCLYIIMKRCALLI